LVQWESGHEEPRCSLRKGRGCATAIEYGLIAALIAVAIIGAARALGTQIGDTINTVVTEMQSTQ
jgi:pilus assembly protein Flp/PilA